MVCIAHDADLLNREANEISAKLGTQSEWSDSNQTFRHFSFYPLSRSPNKSHFTRANWGQKEKLIHQQNLTYRDYLFKTDLSYNLEITPLFFDRLRKQAKKKALCFCLYREKTKKANSQGQIEEGKEHHHLIWQSPIEKEEVRELFTNAFMSDIRRHHEREFIKLDIHHQEIDQAMLDALLVYNTKATKKLAYSVCLFPPHSRLRKAYGEFFHKPPKTLWKEWIAATYEQAE